MSEDLSASGMPVASEADDEGLVYFNGINIRSGEYLLPPILPADLCRMAQQETFDPRHSSELRAKALSTEPHLGVEYGIDPTKLEDAGWGVIFAQGADPAIHDALKTLLTHREAQASKTSGSRYKVYMGDTGYQAGESCEFFLGRRGAAPGPVDPDRMPYYLLIVGDPETIPFSFQQDMDVQYGVGRIHFDCVEQYAQYAKSVVAAESGVTSLTRRAVFFATSDDEGQARSCARLITPLAEIMKGAQPGWEVESVLGDDARKEKLCELLGGGSSPALLFTSTHGGYLPFGDPDQVKLQGGLVCQKSTLLSGASAPGNFFLFGEDISDSALVPNMITIHFACFGAGTPRENNFLYAPANRYPTELTTHSFVAELPKRLLGHAKGGTLAFVGHVERAWGCSYSWGKRGAQLGPFKNMLRVLMDGHPVGWATEFLNQRYADLSVMLMSELRDKEFGKQLDDKHMAFLWTANHDARNYIVLGDPAVRLPISGQAAKPGALAETSAGS